MEKIGTIAYKLSLPPTRNVHLVFHVSHLKKAQGSITASTTIPSQLNYDTEIEFVPKAILGVKKKGLQSLHVEEVLIKWQGLPNTYNQGHMGR